MERIISKYSSVNPNIFFYHLQTILFMGTKPARRCEKRHKNRWNFYVNDMLGTLILGKIHKEMESYFLCAEFMFLKVVQKYFELGKSQESTCFDSSSFQTVSEDTTGCLTGRANRLGITTDIKKVNWMLLSDFSINLWSCSLIISKCPYK